VLRARQLGFCQVTRLPDRATNSKLHVGFPVNQALFQGALERGTVAVGVFGVLAIPGVRMRGELDDDQWPVFLGVGTQERKRNRAVTTQGSDITPAESSAPTSLSMARIVAPMSTGATSTSP